MADLTAANEGRLSKSLDKLYRFRPGVMSLREYIDKYAVGFKTADESKYMYNRTKYNRMNNAEQREYEKKLEQRTTNYYAIIEGDGTIQIPKIVYEHYAQLKETL
jgi:hypothetical protein